ncbi:MAG: alpha/beta fold hydrolase, partial [Planctomycetes bacterium]|nr:alpha/beta fold hydrolase [Planctomycetota bacterium]
DVNRDGKLDIVCGGWWYEAPTWKKHFVRDVKMIRGRYDGYSHLPYDVDQDGWPDLINVNYRSQAIYWVQHPGKELGEWKKIVVDTPGPMETGRLVDIDGDGKVDLLPNGVRFAAWWEIVHDKTADGKNRTQWIRHDLPDEVGGHGVGFGDINGDGRGDIVGPRGWAEAPKDPRKGRWIWRPEFQLHRDCGLPILVEDVDEDGDNDIVWGRGHHTGLYWLEQTRDDKGKRLWTKHVIDTSWSQAHSLLWADIDNDQKPELIAGKRYMGHDGKDPGEYDPLVSYWYKFDAKKRTWDRNLISYGWHVGYGLDPKAVDIDGDGDLDIVAAGRSGLYLLENRKLAGVSRQAKAHTPYNHQELLAYCNDGKLNNVSSHATWAHRRRDTLSGMIEAMGWFTPTSRRVPLDVKVVSEEKTNKYLRRKITFASEPGDRVPAYLLIPNDLKAKAPAMLCLHQTTGIGKGEPAGLGGRKTLHYAHELAERGYVCIVPDYPSFGDYKYDFKKDDYQSGTMKAIWNNVRALDVLETLPQVDIDRVGCIGHSLGGHNALFTAPFDLRIKAVVTSCGFTAFHHYYGGKLAGWTSDRYMPQIRDQYGNDPDKMPFDFYEVLAATAPRGIFINAPVRDSNFDITGVKKVVTEVRKVYELLGAKENLVAVHPNSAHDFPDDVRRQAYEWLDGQLK